MEPGVRFNIQDARAIRRALEGLNPRVRNSAVGLALVRIGRRTEALAKEKYIVRGRGLKSKPLRNRVTFRTGRLTRSISTDESASPRRVVVGSRVVYAPVHELGLTVNRPIGPSRSNKKRGRLKGSAVYPKRPFLEPAALFVIRREAADIMRRSIAQAQR